MKSGPMTFVSTAGYPRRRADLGDIATTAVNLLKQRETGYPKAVGDRKMTQDAADRGLRIMAAVAQLWRLVVDSAPLPHPSEWGQAFAAGWVEMREETAVIANRARQMARNNPDQRDLRVQAELAEALAWHHQPVAAGSGPHIWLAHEYNLWERGRAAE
ncbi:hypothetical protein SUS17_2078 [Sphingomonas sp. S17]|uniref:hypothetical protein n=1 Tax=Sphingomonas sp. S17 TaxID=1007104 RepID=UPI00020A24E2|nr:hypothetical protein [Sphingomonas sp. S17]EGI55003.1 hypothetical protein SUS17_2078 [Sphingomonas sp. S17]